MIELYTWGTPNGQKISIALEELDLPYTVHPIDLMADAQNLPEFRKIAPNGRIPAIVDTDTGISMFESGAILVYLAEKTGKLLAPAGAERADAMTWLFWQMAGLGPMIGQWGHFVRQEDKLDYAIERYLNESLRLFAVLDERLGEVDYLAGSHYSIADIASFPWVIGGFDYIGRFAPGRLPSYANIERWKKAIAKRPAVERGMAVPKSDG